ncbi:MAG: glycosyltransferase [Legionella sp.]|nr:glycosyltransferase [Legionella sp.]
MINLPTFEMGNHIPKLIHQTFPNKTHLPSDIEKNISSICTMNPNWKYCMYDDTDIETTILKYYNLELLQIYKKINPAYGAARADFFRYLLMYAVGGVYLDIKGSVKKPFDEILLPEDRYILSHWDKPHLGNHPGLRGFDEYQQWHIITVKGHPFLRRIIERVIDNIQNYNIFKFGIGKKGVLKLTGPIPYTLVIMELKHAYPFRQVESIQEFGLIYSIYQSYAHKNHRKFFKKHYSKLKRPIVFQPNFKSRCICTLFYLVYLIKLPIRKLIKLTS